eukprot:gene21867-42035_t
MNQMKISTRLSGAFGLLVALLLAMAGVALLELRDLRGSSEEISENWLP